MNKNLFSAWHTVIPRSAFRCSRARFIPPIIYVACRKYHALPRARYIYSPLPTKDSIRLLKIQKRDEKDKQVSISLEAFQHSRVIDVYKALSYTWGAPYGSDQEDYEDYKLQRETSKKWSDFSIICNGKYLTVGKNLLEALSQLQTSREEGWLWVDAICINQEDENEKSIQIMMMADVYSGASMVVVWLGVLDSKSEKALDFISKRQKKELNTQDGQQEPRDPLAADTHEQDEGSKSRPLEAAESSDGLSEYPTDEWRSFQQFFHRRWFRRVWIVQEIALAKDEIALCGPLQFKIRDILRFAHSLAGGESLSFSNPRQLGAASSYHQQNAIEKERLGAYFVSQLGDWTRTQFSWHIRPESRSVLRQHRCVGIYLEMSTLQKFGTWFEILLEQLSGREVTHRADIVFAALNLMSRIAPIADDPSKLANSFELDYRRPAADNYFIITAQLLALTNGLGMLSLVDGGGESPAQEMTTGYLPSWVPDINKPLSSSRLLAQDFNASSSLGTGDSIRLENFGCTVAVDVADDRMSDKGVHLALKGVILGSIKALSSPTAAADTESWCQTMSSIPDPDWSAVYSSLTHLDVLARTLCACNEGIRFQPTDSNMRKNWCAFLIFELLNEALLHHLQTGIMKEAPGNLIDTFWTAKNSTTLLLQGSSAVFGKEVSLSTFKSIVERLVMDDILFAQPELAPEFSSLRLKWKLPPLPSAEDLVFARTTEMAGAFYSRLAAPFAERRLFASSSGHVGLAPPGARTGDLVVFVQKGRLPFIVRAVKSYEGVLYTLVGDAYVDGLMYGEIRDRGLSLEDVFLV